MSSEAKAPVNKNDSLLLSPAVPVFVKRITYALRNKNEFKNNSQYFNPNGKLHSGIALRSFGLMAASLVNDKTATLDQKKNLFDNYADLVKPAIAKGQKKQIKEQIEGSRAYLNATLDIN